jgi:hypothetical protein
VHANCVGGDITKHMQSRRPQWFESCGDCHLSPVPGALLRGMVAIPLTVETLTAECEHESFDDFKGCVRA